jgi:uncharacterized protein (DUF305 family)
MGVDMTVFLADGRGKLRNVSATIEPEVTHPSAVGEPSEAGSDTELLPWHRNPVNLISILLAVAVLAGAIGWVVGNNRAIADPNATDIGFLQDMRVHHEQAVQMSLIYLADDDTDRNLAIVAREILIGQNIEIGRMIQMLRGFGESEVNETDLGMAWMNEPVALDRMPGMATQSDLEALADATGAEANVLFVRLMSAHHQGGIHMAEYAATHGATEEVRLMASKMASSQAEEITELARLLAMSQG